MARKPRFNLPGYPQHVVQRGNNRQSCFFSPSDYLVYLECISDACSKYSCQVHAYVLMTNHVHLLITPLSPQSISQVMQSTGRRYVRYINDRYSRSGSLWEGRYKASLVDEDKYFLACCRYIELNPVRAGMVEDPKEYEWSSYCFHAYGHTNGLLSAHPVYLDLAESLSARQNAYRELFNDQLGQEHLYKIRRALNRELVLGSEGFKDDIQKVTKRPTRRRKAGRPARTSRVY